MRKFQITVNGNTYEVDVEEISNGGVITAPVSAPIGQQPLVNNTNSEQKSVTSPEVKSSSSIGSELLEAPMQGKIVGVKVEVGQEVKEGDVVAILEAMKMENEIVAPQAGRVVTVDVATGQSVEAGDLIASLD